MSEGNVFCLVIDIQFVDSGRSPNELLIGKDDVPGGPKVRDLDGTPISGLENKMYYIG